ncbi:hypothetical protein AMTR_s00151p00089350 [Amborella trichopoda]|uniref:Uncharacterized protein n=1 Tax=Amborella trichopoda TaxID=13333 RepID=W1NJ17_AMBTC|nr:hypothetical protein AMTR_s00151p00089350 [Amborella trichopoda]
MAICRTGRVQEIGDLSNWENHEITWRFVKPDESKKLAICRIGRIMTSHGDLSNRVSRRNQDT